MAFDAGMVAAITAELQAAVPSRVEKVLQPDRDEIVLLLHTADGNRRLVFAAGASNPRFGFTETVKENPIAAPMFCMLLRKHLGGARLLQIEQIGFERAVRFTFGTKDELGFAVQRFLILEIMGKYSNLSLLDESDKILGVLRPVDFSMSQKRQLLPGMRYELPPAQEKKKPLTETQEGFFAAARAADGTMPAAKFLTAAYAGLSALSAREIVFCAAKRTDAALDACILRMLWESFAKVCTRIRTGKFSPMLLSDGDGRPMEYSFFPILQYGDAAAAETMPSFCALLDRYFTRRDQIDRMRLRAKDISHLLSTATARLERKLAAQRQELAECEKMDEYRRRGDAITAGIWQLRRGMETATLCDYDADPVTEIQVTLDARLTPAQNAQRYYKRYQKAKTAKEQLTRQVAAAEEELSYLASVAESLRHAEGQSDLDEIRAELYESGYASRMKQYQKKKLPPMRLAEYRTSGGYRVFAGKNNRQNEYLSHRLAGRDDYWFHAKDRPGGHVVLFCAGMEEPSELDFTQAAMIAAWYSDAKETKNIPVDYTKVRYLKKPAGAKPGMVIYHTYWSAYVTPEEEKVAALRKK